MRSLRADLAAAASDERRSAPKAPSDDVRVRSREQLHRADALVNDFRARVRSDLRTHVARGGELVDSAVDALRSEEHTSELQSLMRISYAVFCLKKKTTT